MNEYNPFVPTVALSATLEPFDFYKKTLGLPESRAAEMSLPSPFPRSNRKIVIVAEVDTTYKQRANHYDRIATTVAEIAQASEGNFLALFPSYAFLREIAGFFCAICIPARSTRIRTGRAVLFCPKNFAGRLD